jgi:hypothetical protein
MGGGNFEQERESQRNPKPQKNPKNHYPKPPLPPWKRKKNLSRPRPPTWPNKRSHSLPHFQTFPLPANRNPLLCQPQPQLLCTPNTSFFPSTSRPQQTSHTPGLPSLSLNTAVRLTRPLLSQTL